MAKQSIAQRSVDLFINNPVEHNKEIKIDPVDLSGINCVICKKMGSAKWIKSGKCDTS